MLTRRSLFLGVLLALAQTACGDGSSPGGAACVRPALPDGFTCDRWRYVASGASGDGSCGAPAGGLSALPGGQPDRTTTCIVVGKGTYLEPIIFQGGRLAVLGATSASDIIFQGRTGAPTVSGAVAGTLLLSQLTIVGPSDGPSAAVELASLDELALRDVKVQGGADGVSLRAIGAARADGLEVTGTRARGLVAQDIIFQGRNVTVRSSGSYGIAMMCGAACPGASSLEQVTIDEATGFGLWASGGRLQLTDVSVQGSRAADRFPGYGVVATDRAQLVSTRLSVARNASAGLVVDSSTGTFEDLSATDNGDRGAWFQHIDAAMPETRISGASTVLRGNALLGFGAREASNIIFQGGQVLGTRPLPTLIMNRLVDRGDGIGLFAGTRAVRVESVTLGGNSRAQILVDQVGNQSDAQAGIIFQGITINAPSTDDPRQSNDGRWNLVFQNGSAVHVSDPATMALVQAPPAAFGVAVMAVPIAGP